MLEVADIIREHGAAYQARRALLPSQQRALRDIQNCRTAHFGGHVAQCDHCGLLHYAYHSCRNRHCPKCHGQQADAWLEAQQAHLLPVPHYLLTFTLPAELRPLAFRHQKLVYGALMRCAAAALLKLTADPRWLGATPTILAVLHTWTRALLYHPHVHLLVSAGGLSADGQRWLAAKHPAFLVPVRALSVIFRAKLREALRRAGLLEALPTMPWRKPWVVHAQAARSGANVLRYLARYVFRVAISNSRLESFDNGQVTFRYHDRPTGQLRKIRLPVEEFLDRFLRHVLPLRFAKVRHYGLASTARARERRCAQTLLGPPLPAFEPSSQTPTSQVPLQPPAPLCPRCHCGHLLPFQTLRPRRKFPP